jgi:phosphoglycolate phosphatase-like HAD superfamily hydrolase
MVRLVLFDIDGTLVRTGGAGVKAFAKVFETEFGARDGFERLKFAGRTDLSLVREFFGYHDIAATPKNFRRFFERYVFWLDQILSESKGEVCHGVWEFICSLQEMSPAPLLGLLTGNIRLGAEIKLRHFDLWQSFAVGAFADDHEERDQIAAIARERGERSLNSKLKDEQVLVIGDTPLDIRCGRAIGAKVLAVATGGSQLSDLQRHAPDWVVPDLTAIDAGVVAGV